MHGNKTIQGLVAMHIYNDAIYRYIDVQSRREALADRSYPRLQQLHLLMRVSRSL
jgi:hypothetical protein